MADEITRMKRHTAEDIENAIDMLLESYTREEIDTMLENKVSKDGNKVLTDNNYSDEEKRKLAEIDIPAIKAEIGGIANSGAKNVLRNDGTNRTSSNVTFVPNSDGSITVTTNGKASGYVDYLLSEKIYPKRKYILSIYGDNLTSTCPARVYHNNVIVGRAYVGQNATFDSEIDKIVFTVVPDAVINTTVKIMLRDASIEDDTFVPYVPSNRELYEMILALQNNPSALSEE